MPSSPNSILKAIRQLINKNTLENAQSLAGLIDVRLDDGLSDKYTDENYRYKDVGYIAGSRKEQAQASIFSAKKEGLQVYATDIDWDALEEDSRIAADTITKKNVFGQVDWDRLKAGGMHGNVGYLIKRIYAAVALKPDIDDAETRKLYVVAIQNLRQIFEKCKTYEDALNELVALSKLLNTYRNMVKGEDGKSTLNYDSLVAHALGKKFKSWVFKSGNKALHESKKMAIDDWSWLEPSDKMTTSAPKKKPFQLEAAADINRIGGAKVDIKSTEQFKDTFGLKAIQSGNWVLKDKESIEFHVQRSAEAMSDMADVTGIPAHLLGFGGRLGLAFGARGKGGALAHYEPVQRVINITKMKGGGSLGHEYFHALDNIISDLIHQKDNGAAGYFATENPKLLPDGLVKEAFAALRQAMKISARNSRMMTITEDIRNKAKQITVLSLIDNLRINNVDLSTPNKLIEALANHAGNRYTGVYRDKEISKQGVYVVLACMIHLGMITGNENEVEFPVLWEQSDFEKAAIRLDEGKQGKYWSKTLEMAARAYSAYLQDRLDEQGRVNDYLAYSTKGGNNRVGESAYPQGKEREAINAAFDKLFLAIKKEQVFEKAVANKDLMDSIFGNTSANGVIKAIRALLANNTYENANQLASLAGLTLVDPNKKIEVVEHTTKKGKVIRGVVRTDLSYSEAKAIDEYTFKKDGGWFIREKHLGLESQSVTTQQTPTETPKNEPVAVVESDTLVNDADNNIEGLTRKFKPAAKKYKNPEIRLEPKEGAKLLKKTLIKLFPDTKFSVAMSRGTAYGSVSVSWVDGASYDLVNVIAQHFRGNGYDGMSDSTYYLNAINEDGKVVDYGLGYVSISRSYSREFLEKLQASFSNMLQNRIKQEGVTIKGDVFNAYFDAKEHFTQGKINDAKVSHSTGKYRYGGMLDMLSANEPPYIQQEGENNVPSTSNAMESDSDNTISTNQKQSAENGNANESGELGRLARPPVNGLDARGGSERDSGLSLPKNDGIGVGARGDTSVSDGAGERGVGASNTATKSSRSSRTNEQRTPVERERDRAVVRTATTTGSVTQTAKEAEQLKAEGTPTQWGDAANIDKALPYLLPEQRDDVAKLEKRLIEENKNGMLFTNGTGTGKTFTGLGAVKRFANAGKKNILIVSMNDKIIRDFIKSAKSLNLDVHQLDGITDNGKDKIVATTYANMAQNNTLGMRDWDLIVVDEAHNLMQGEKGEHTNALAKLRALSGHYAGFYEWVQARYPKPYKVSDNGIKHISSIEVAAWEKTVEPLRKEWQKTWAEQPKGRTKVIFLTATPFSYVKTLDWAEGYLFDFVPPADKFSNKTDAMGLAYNSGGAQERFYMSNFGYKMRNNRLTRPNSKVDVGILERKFAEKLKTEGAMSGRELSVPFDYDRKFVLVNSKIGEKIDEGFKFLWDTKGKDGRSKYSDLLRVINKRFDYLARLQLLEAIKAEEAIDQIKKHLALGRKVIVFHDFNEGGTTNPFVVKGGLGADDATSVESQYDDFKRERPDLINLKLDIPAPLVTLRKAFPNALLFNGRVAKGQRNKNADLFNSDDSGLNVMIAQSDAAATGISFHDTTGKHQRVIINIGMPTKPAKLRQTEGRIYRVGQASNAIQRYLTTGTDWERIAFSQKIAERAETVDNLAQGESAVVSIKDALVRAYEEAEYFEPSENDGIGGKAYDEENARINKLTPFERAKSDYWVKQKITAKRSEREGKEWYATPEPVGLFMVNLAGAHSGDDILEPSAGDGAIGRYMPSDASVTFIEPSESLASRARMNNTNANVIVDDFESHGSNNKYDAIVMNPPFGQGGSIAIKHLVKSFEHLRDGGRVVALLPVGKMDELIAKYNRDGYFKDIYTVAEFTLPSSTFENAGTRVNTKIHVFEKHENKDDAPQGVIVKDLSHYDDISQLFDAIENISIKPRKPRVDEALAEYGIQVYPDRSKYIVTGEGLKRMDIKSLLFTTYDKPNADGDYVEKYNYSKQYLRLLKENNTATTEQFNQGLSGNNLPIKYQDPRSGLKHNVWDGFGEKPYWLTQALQYGKKLEDFAVEKPVYDSVTNNDPKEIIAAIRKLMTNNTPENARTLAEAAGLSIEKPRPLLSSEDINGLNKTLVLPENATKGDRKRAVAAWLKENLLGKQIKTSDDKVVRFNSDQSVKHLKYNGERNNLKAKVIPYIAEVFAFGEFVGRFPNDDHSNSNVFLAFHYYRKWCKVDDRELYLEAHAGEYENGSLELVAYNQKDITKLLGSDPSALNISKDTQAEGLPNKENNKPVFDDVQVSDDLTVEDGDLVRILEVKALAVNDEPQLSANQVLAKAGINGIDYNLSLNDYGKLLGFNDDEVSDILLFNKEPFNDDSEYTKLIREISSVIYEAKTSLKKPDTLHTSSQYKAYVQRISKLDEAQNLLNYAQKRFENPFLYRGKEQMPQFLKVRFEKRFEQVPTGDKAREEKGKKEFAWKIELLKKAFDENNRFDDIGGFNFKPAIDLDQTLKAIKETLANGSHDNIKHLAMLAGVTLLEPTPDVELDMFGEPINQDFDLFGDPIQDGEDSPVEELPRLAVVELPLSKLTLSEDVPQFKSGADDESGVVEALGGKFDRTGVAPIQVWERTDGRLEIISGRHRTDLARRSGEKTIPAQVHKESEGFTAKQAMMLDAELNIRDGQGKVKDYVDYFTHSEISEEEADRRGLISRAIGQRAFAIASKGSEELITLHRNEIISDQAAAEISSIAPNNSAMQAVGLRVLQDNKPLNNALNTIRAVQALTREKGQEPDTFDLFGFDDSALKEAEAMARIASRKQRQIAEQLNAIKGAVKNPKLAAKHGVMVENEADALAKVKTMTAQKARWDNWSSHADLLAEVREELNAKFDSLLDDEDDYYWLCQEELAL